MNIKISTTLTLLQLYKLENRESFNLSSLSSLRKYFSFVSLGNIYLQIIQRKFVYVVYVYII